MTIGHDRFLVLTENSAIGRSAYLLSFIAPGCVVILFLSRMFILSLLPLFAYSIFVFIALVRRQTVWESLAFPRKVNQVSVIRKSGFLRPSRFYKVRVQLTDGRHYSFRVPESEIDEVKLNISYLFPKDSINFNDEGCAEKSGDETCKTVWFRMCGHDVSQMKMWREKFSGIPCELRQLEETDIYVLLCPLEDAEQTLRLQAVLDGENLPEEHGLDVSIVTDHDNDGLRLDTFISEFYRHVGGTLDFSFVAV